MNYGLLDSTEWRLWTVWVPWNGIIVVDDGVWWKLPWTAIRYYPGGTEENDGRLMIFDARVWIWTGTCQYVVRIVTFAARISVLQHHHPFCCLWLRVPIGRSLTYSTRLQNITHAHQELLPHPAEFCRSHPITFREKNKVGYFLDRPRSIRHDHTLQHIQPWQRTFFYLIFCLLFFGFHRLNPLAYSNQ
jgi:hypothetical protein